MSSYSAACFDAGLFTVLSVVLNSTTPGYAEFCRQAKDSWQSLGLAQEAIEAIISQKKSRKTEEIRDALRIEMPKLIGESYGDIGRCYYELGFWCGTLFLALISDLNQIIEDSIRNLRYKCAEAKNPKPMLDFVNTCKDQIAKGEKIDIVRLASFAEEFHLWIVANVEIERKKSLKETIVAISLGEVPYLGKILKAIYEHPHTEDESGKKKPWWRIW